MNTPQQLHIPVLQDAVLSVLSPKVGDTYLDLTAGYGGHAKPVIATIGDASLATLVDRDKTAINALQPLQKAGAHVIKSDFLHAARQLYNTDKRFNLILLDLGVSSPQLDTANRGFSFMQEGPLDMRMDTSTGDSARHIVNTASQQQLLHILREFGEEPLAGRIAKAIVQQRPLHTTTQLASLVAQVYRGRRTKTHPATRTFQALRIAVNDELGQLSSVLPLLPGLLHSGGRLAIISFHSLEDRLVKRFLQEQSRAGYEATLQLISKRPISGDTHDVSNPRARSAKLRAAVKINT